LSKRSLDIFGSLAGLVLLAPLFAVVALVIKATSPGSVFFRQERVGRAGQIFRIYKFRSMRADAHQRGSQVTSSNDSRITRIGAFLRRHKLDEYPQLINVLRGQMSLVGPRPEVPRYVEHYPEKFALVCRQKPGMTHRVSLMLRNEEIILGGVTDPETLYIRSVLPWKLDLYIENEGRDSVWDDLRTIWNTVFCRDRQLQELVPRFDSPVVANVEPFPEHIASRISIRSGTEKLAHTGTGRG
jgi:lipopolysaccharide/colanic/teichoic acid biosynthesis glycosyltransferase